MAYLTPDEIPEGEICRPLFIPNSSAWLAIVSGAITELSRSWNWEQFGAVTPEEAAARMWQMAVDYYNTSCGSICAIIYRVGIGGVLEQSTDGGTTWTAPTGDAEIPTLEARTEPTADERKCLAAANAANVLAQVYEAFIDAWNTDHSLEFGTAAFAAIWAGLVGVWLGIIVAAAIPVAWGIFALAYQALEFLFADSWDAEFNDKIRCILYNCATDTDGVVTFDYDCFLEAINATFWVDPVEARLVAQINYMMLFIGATGLNHAGTTTGITMADCDDCDENWCYTFDFAVDDGGFVLLSGLPEVTPTSGTYVGGTTGWGTQDVVTVSTNRLERRVAIKKVFPSSARVTGAAVVFDFAAGKFDAGASAPGLTYTLTVGGVSTLIGDYPYSAALNGTDQVRSDSGDWLDVTEFTVFMRCSSDGTVPRSVNGSCNILSVTLSGKGENPFGEDNC